jgi:hypothetical protein
MFKYLLIKAACDFVAMSIEPFSNLKVGNFELYYGSLSDAIFEIYFNQDILQIVLMLSALMEVMATLGISFKLNLHLKCVVSIFTFQIYRLLLVNHK